MKLTFAGLTDGASLGYDVSVSGNRIVAGAPYDDATGPDSGSVTVHEHDGTDWIESTRLLASDDSSQDHFGQSVAVLGDVIVVGAVEDQVDGLQTGSVYVYEHVNDGWHETKLPVSAIAQYGSFGESVAISSNHVVIGAPLDMLGKQVVGSSFIYDRYAAVNQEQGLYFFDLHSCIADSSPGDHLAVRSKAFDVDGIVNPTFDYIS